jgi:hypothetical protein
MSNVFDAYIDEFSSINSDLKSLIGSFSASNNSLNLPEIDNKIAEGYELIKMIETEIRCQRNQSAKKDLSEKSSQLKGELKQRESEYLTIKREKERAAVLGGNSSRTTNQRQKVLDSNDK